MNFLFVDRIYDLVPGKSTLGVKHVTPSDAYLFKKNTHASIMSCIIGEALGQLCSWNVIKTSDFKLRLVGGIVGEVNVYEDAYLGETIILENQIDAVDLENQVMHFHGTARVGTRKILSVENGLGPLLPIRDFDEVENVKRQLKCLWRKGTAPASKEYQLLHENFIPAVCPHVNYDRILHWENNKSMIAEKLISQSAPYFVDHFPDRPVLPLSFLLECTLQLGYQFIAESDPVIVREFMQVRKIKRIKMMEFVEPGDIVRTEITMLEKTSQKIILNFEAKVDDKKVCLAKAEYELKQV